MGKLRNFIAMLGIGAFITGAGVKAGAQEHSQRGAQSPNAVENQDRNWRMPDDSDIPSIVNKMQGMCAELLSSKVITDDELIAELHSLQMALRAPKLDYTALTNILGDITWFTFGDIHEDKGLEHIFAADRTMAGLRGLNALHFNQPQNKQEQFALDASRGSVIKHADPDFEYDESDNNRSLYEKVNEMAQIGQDNAHRDDDTLVKTGAELVVDYLHDHYGEGHIQHNRGEMMTLVELILNGDCLRGAVRAQDLGKPDNISKEVTYYLKNDNKDGGIEQQ